MENRILFTKFYLDKEKDLVVSVYRTDDPDVLDYVIATPNHHNGNLINNLASICKLEAVPDEDGILKIYGSLNAVLDIYNEDVFLFRLGGIKVASIYRDGSVSMKAKIPAINKILMSQTKLYKYPKEQTIMKSYIYKKSKFRTDLHTHMNAILPPECLMALGLKHQIKYPLYYILKLNLKITDRQSRLLEAKRKKVEEEIQDLGLTGKAFERKVKDLTYINFADLIFKNLDNAEENLNKIANSLVLIKDGQAVFTNLDKLYVVYRYIFTKGQTVEENELIDLTEDMMDRVPEEDVKKYLFISMSDLDDPRYEKNTILQDKLLWIAREYKRQSIDYVEIATTDLCKMGDAGINYLKQIHEVMPNIEEETGVRIRFLAGIRRVGVEDEDVKNSLIALKSLAKSPYLVGSDILGEEINDISLFKGVIDYLVKYVINEDNDFTIRIHAGENDSFKDNVSKAVECVYNSIPKGSIIPRVRLGHGLYVEKLNTVKGKKLIEKLKEMGVILEFQLSSNVRLNNLLEIKRHPIKAYLSNGVKCVQGTDGFSIYGTDTFEEQLALHNLLNLNDEDFFKMRKVEDELIERNEKYFEKKKKLFDEFINEKDFYDAFKEYQEEVSKDENIKKIVIWNDFEDSNDVFKEKIIKLPQDKMPIVIAGGSFNSNNRVTSLNEKQVESLEKLISGLDENKVYFVIGSKMEGYEKEVINLAKKMNKNFEINAIVPKLVNSKEKKALMDNDINGVCVSTEAQTMGIYKSFNYEIFERRDSIVLAFDGNTPAANLIQEAKNGKGKSKIFVNNKVEALEEKAKSLEGYVEEFESDDELVDKIFREYPNLKK
ncbi:MAG: adenosine deaminase [Clostridia bacterium]|nr:adenosine deaminase [Clostridia bacterium]